MGRIGRYVSVFRWGTLGMLCLTGLGCGDGSNSAFLRPPAPGDFQQGVASQNALPGNSIQQTGYAPDGMPRVDEQAPSPMPVGPEGNQTLQSKGVTGGCPDGNCADGKNGFPNEGYRRLPTELAMVTHPPYIIAAPDILLIDTARLVPKPPYVVQPLDVLILQATGTFEGQPINGPFVVGPDGNVALGFGYGSVRVVGMTLENAQAAIRTQLLKSLKDPVQVSLGLGAFQTAQQVRGEHLVRADGTISLGVYGCVYVAGMTLCQAQTVIEQHLAGFFQDPEIAVDIFAYNSKVYYVVVDGGGFGMQVVRFPVTGNETVLDAIERIGGLPAVSSRKKIWVARPTPANHSCNQILPVDWLAIVQGGSTRTNYQLFPGDRIYIKADPFITLDNALAKVISPIQRLLGVTLLGTSVYNSFRNNGNNSGFGIIATGR